MSLRGDRVQREWQFLERLAQLNPDQLELLGRSASPSEDVFRFRLHRSAGIEAADGPQISIRDRHTMRLVFTRFYPDVPIECYIEERLFHPNVRPETGFVCLWEQGSVFDTAIQAVARAQATAAYRMVNTKSVHVMNRAADVWYREVARRRNLVPLPSRELNVYEIRSGELVWLEPHRNLGARRRPRLV